MAARAEVVSLLEDGVASWRETEAATGGCPLATLSLVAVEEEPLLEAAVPFVELLSRRYRHGCRWHTAGEDVRESRARAIIVSRALAEPVPGFGRAATTVPVPPAVPAVAATLLPPLDAHHLATIPDHDHTMLVLAPSPLDAKTLVELLAPAPLGIRASWLAEALCGPLAGMAVVRLFLWHSDACVQIHAGEATVRELAPEVERTLGLDRVDAQGLAAFLAAGRTARSARP